tara:strand:- start:81 stop:299 length:219 start_codon:yes stop_codon:yes gene_type:complete
MNKKKKIKEIKIKKSLQLVDKIQKARSRNNKNWMDLLRLAIKLDQKKASLILHQIYKHDQKISILAKKLYKI